MKDNTQKLTAAVLHAFIFAVAVIAIIALVVRFQKEKVVLAIENTSWKIQSVDTMKFSRDLAREKLADEDYDKEIESQITKIANLGATHVAIGTPYDDEFIPFMKRWIDAARARDLNVWFRGNFSGWENWFDYEDIDSQEHLNKTGNFIVNNPELFEDGDIFTSCTECENGQLGDPRFNGDLEGFRKFIYDSYNISKQSFEIIGKDVSANYFSMNGDVANLVMSKEFSEKLDSIIVIDHYVADPQKLNSDINILAEETGAKIMLGEYGAPIPDIHGVMTEEEQAEWIDTSLDLLYKNTNVHGLNYWVLSGGSTTLLDDKGNLKKSAAVLSDYFRPKSIVVNVENEIGLALNNTEFEVGTRIRRSDNNGNLNILYIDTDEIININADGYVWREIPVTELTSDDPIVLVKEKESLIFTLLKNLRKRLFLN